MNCTTEMNALFTLIDDPDQEVYSTVSEKIVGFGRSIIPNLENLWENTPHEDVQERIEDIIHRLQFSDLYNEMQDWKENTDQELLYGALLVAKYQFPDLQIPPILQEIEKIKRNIWLELNCYLTPLEQANVFSSILYNYYNFTGNEVNYRTKDDFFLNRVIAKKKGNTLTNGILYQIMCDTLDINARIINIPGHFLIAFFHSDYDPNSYIGNPQNKIHFFVDGTNGKAYAHLDVENYLRKSSLKPLASYFKPLKTKRIIKVLIEELSKCYRLPSENYQQLELIALADILA